MSLEQRTRKRKNSVGTCPILDMDIDIVPLNIRGDEFLELLEIIPVNSQERSFIHTSMLMN